MVNTRMSMKRKLSTWYLLYGLGMALIFGSIGIQLMDYKWSLWMGIPAYLVGITCGFYAIRVKRRAERAQ